MGGGNTFCYGEISDIQKWWNSKILARWGTGIIVETPEERDERIQEASKNMLRFLGGVASLGFLPAARKYFFKPMRESNKQITEKQRQKKAQPVHNAAETGAGAGLIVRAHKAPRVMKKESAENLTKADKERRNSENEEANRNPTRYKRELLEDYGHDWGPALDNMDFAPGYPKYTWLEYPVLKTERFTTTAGGYPIGSHSLMNVGRTIYDRTGNYSMEPPNQIIPENLDTVYWFSDNGYEPQDTYTTQPIRDLLGPITYDANDAKRFFYQQLYDPTISKPYSFFNDEFFGSPDIK